MTRTLILLVAVCVPSRGLAAQESPPDVSALAFGWPVGLTARVTHAREQIMSAALGSEGEHCDTSGAVLRSSMHVREHPGGLQVSYDDFAIEMLPGGNQLAEILLLRQALASVVSLVVSDEGIPGDIVGLEDAPARVRSLLEPVFASLPRPRRPDPWEWDKMKAEGMQELAAAGALVPWGYLVSAWADEELERGAVRRMEVESELLMFPGVTAPFVHEITFSSREPCTPSASEDSCVVLEIESAPEPERFAAIVDSLISSKGERMGFPLSGTLVSMEVRNHVRLVTEPTGLIPHRLDVVTWFKQTMALGDDRGWNEMTTRDAYRFAYSP